jgi:hypothetical protein
MGQDVEELRTDIERSREDLGGTLDAIGDRISPGRMMSRQRNRALSGWHSVRDRVMGTVADAGDRASDLGSSVTDRVGPEAVRRQAEGSPLAAGLVAFGLGVVTAAVFPPTEVEERMASAVKDKAEPLKAGVMDAGREVVDDLKQQASDAGRELNETATDAAGQVADRAKSAAADIRQER